ncbi:sensor histidine kinase [Kitasatospora viridis]|uniref:histidine kinase n=1 Tax=Kitasatospora viridis TaxID=281105 RepID=A0A561T6S4_9ACTN|nr:HAMP domain-containing sensor histidine kinase [Kitasatospora viridis]TWF82825.1 signal transduction histidine kinase [Kitasatospora viridis]
MGRRPLGIPSWLPWPGVRARAALGALIASAIAFSVIALWVEDSVHRQLLGRARERAGTAVENVQSKIPNSPDESYQDATYVVMTVDGRWLRSNKMFQVYETGAYRTGLVPFTPQDEVALDQEMTEHPDRVNPFGPITATFPPGLGPGPESSALKGRTLQFYRGVTNPLSSDQIAQYSGVVGLPNQSLTIYVMVDPQEADKTAAAVTSLLRYLAPAASLCVALTAWLVTGLALRPVESIRRRMAEIGDGAYHERVPVPPGRDRIARLAETTNDTLDQLERSLTEQRRLVADASHELRSPLAALRSSLEVPLAHPEQADWPAVAAGALAETERLQELADDLLLLARTEEAGRAGAQGAAGAVAREPGSVELHDLVAEQLAERAHLDRVPAYRFELAEATVPGREVLVGRLVRNLLDNAARHAGSTVTVRLRTADGWAELTVDDDGPGIPAADRERIFDRFVRLDTARNRAAGGAGLGLALVRTIAGTLGGSVAAEEPPVGRGAHLVVRLPLIGEAQGGS